MRTYQKVGLAGGIIILVASVLFGLFSSIVLSNAMARGIYRTMPIFTVTHHMLPLALVWGLALIGIISGVLGIVGSAVNSYVGGGVLLILGALFSLPVFFGVFGIAFILMLIGGILGIADRNNAYTRPVTTEQAYQQPQPPAPAQQQ
jgi:hypothetical protein